MSSTAGAIRQGRAFVELFTDDTELQRGLRRAENSVKKFGDSVSKIGRSLMTAGAAILAPLGLAVREYTKAGSELSVLSKRTGIAVESLSKLDYALRENGSSLEDFERAMRFAQKTLAKSEGLGVQFKHTKNGDTLKDTHDAVAALGLDIKKLSVLSPEDQFFALADAISRIADPTQRAAEAIKMFGRGGTSLLPLLSQGKDGMRRLMEEAGRLGLVMSTQDADAAHVLENALTRVEMQGRRLAGTVGAALAPALESLATWISGVIPLVRAWVNEHRDLIVMLAKAAVYAVGMGAALYAIGKVLTGISALFGAMRVAVTMLSFAVGLFTGIGRAILFVGSFGKFAIGAFQGIRAAILAAAASGSLLATGIGLLVVGGIAALLYFTGGVQEMGRVFRAVIGGMGEALAAGDIRLAAQILWAGIRLTWTEGMNWIENIFTRMTTNMAEGFIWAGAAIRIAWHSVCGALNVAWNATIAGLLRTWTMFSAWVQRKWAELKGHFDSTIDVKAEVRRIDDERDRKINEITQQHGGKWDDTSKQLAEDRKERDDIIKDLWAGHDEGTSDRAAEIAKRQKELDDLIAQAKREKEALKKAAIPAVSAPPQTASLPAAVQDSFHEVVGSFNINALQSLQATSGSGHLANIEGHTKRTADGVAKLGGIEKDNNERDSYGA